jgi:hypothetical protein
MKSIIGTWRLVKTLARNDAGAPMHPPYGPKPRGLVVFYPDKRMMSVLCDGRSELPPGETVREYNSYCGNYEFDGENLVTRVDASASKDRIGGEQRRFVRFEGEHMVLTQKPRPVAGRDAAPRTALGTHRRCAGELGKPSCKTRKKSGRLVDARKDDYEALSDRVWGMPELCYGEYRSSPSIARCWSRKASASPKSSPASRPP